MYTTMKETLFDYYKKLHPDWSDEQIWIAVALHTEEDKAVENNKDFDEKDPEFLKSIIASARNWLKEILPGIFAKVGQFFDHLINNIGVWVQKGLSYAIDAIEYIYDKGKTVIDALKK